MRAQRSGIWRGLFSELTAWMRGVSRAYCEGAVRRSLAPAPLGGCDWFTDAVQRGEP